MRSAPPLVVSPPVAYLECSNGPPPPPPPQRRQRQEQPHEPAANAGASSGDFLMAISGDGDVFVWNLGTMTLAAKSSLAPLFRSVTSSGVPPRSSTASSTSAAASAAAAGGAGGGGGSGVPTSPHGGTAGGRGSGSGGGGGSGGAGGGAGGGDVSGKSVSGVTVSRAGVTAEGMPLVMLACSGAFGGSLQAFALHRGLGTWVRVADGRWVRRRRVFRALFFGRCIVIQYATARKQEFGKSVFFVAPLLHET